MSARHKVCRALCESGKFETGQGTCALLCMQWLGPTRGGVHGCPAADGIHGELADKILSVLEPAQ